ncbi:MAG: methyl-accepting chemotaxis protein [Anaerosomatales bacterium]|nr:methyl-accepting chemotaxis protein [Coriobacteriia bacterium]MDI6691892.1 methyl-accepting chemotaxis protein [Anaerosomatales bacterium]
MKLSFRARLLVSLVPAVVVVLAAAGFFGAQRFSSVMEEQGQQAADLHIQVARDLLSEQMASVESAARAIAQDPAVSQSAAGAHGGLGVALARHAGLLGLTYAAVVEPDGTVSGTSMGTQPFRTSWNYLVRGLASTQPTVSIEVVPAKELEKLGLRGALEVPMKETPNGTVVPGENEGALSIVAVAPMGGRRVVAVKTLVRDFDFVDSIVQKVGGTATVFQRGVRVATTVRNDKGERAVGTVVSDAVRKTTLSERQPYRGEAFVVNKTYITVYEPLRDSAGDVVGMLYVGVDKSPYTKATRSFALAMGGAALLAIAVVTLLAFNVSRAMGRPLGEVGEAASRVATGDLTVRVPSGGYREVEALSGSFNEMTNGLRSIISQVEAAVMQLRAVAGEITAASRSSAEHASMQASSVAQSTAALEELVRSFESVTSGAKHVLAIAEDALESAQDGSAHVSGTAHAMDEVAASAREMAEAASAMTAVTRDIEEMTAIIANIAGRTKILALNAAIEAARAGEAGKGFAVVSTEIRGLAESVNESASHIDELVTNIEAAIRRLEQLAEIQATLTQEAASESHASREAFEQIVRQMEDTALAAKQIAEAAAQQDRAADQVVQAMQQVSTSSQETAAAAEQLADSASAVDKETERLIAAISRFKTK